MILSQYQYRNVRCQYSTLHSTRWILLDKSMKHRSQAQKWQQQTRYILWSLFMNLSVALNCDPMSDLLSRNQ